MSEVLTKAAEALRAKFEGADFGSLVRFDIDGEGSLMVDATRTPCSVEPGDGDATVVIGASAETFQSLLAGDISPMWAYTTGKLRIAGDMGAAMKLAGVLG